MTARASMRLTAIEPFGPLLYLERLYRDMRRDDAIGDQFAEERARLVELGRPPDVVTDALQRGAHLPQRFLRRRRVREVLAAGCVPCIQSDGSDETHENSEGCVSQNTARVRAMGVGVGLRMQQATEEARVGVRTFGTL